MRWTTRAALVSAALSATGAAPSAPAARSALVVSLDGFAAPYLRDAALDLPVLRRLAAQGVAGESESVLPSVTWPAHTTLVTGVRPRGHGVVGNAWIDRSSGRRVQAWEPAKDGLVVAPTLYDVAHRAGLRTAALSWPSTNGAGALDFEIPEVYDAAAFERWVTPALREELTAAGVAVGRLPELAKSELLPLDEVVAAAAERLILAHDVRLMLVHFTSGDTLGHRHGARSAAHARGLEAYDDLLGRLIQALHVAGKDGETAVFVVSDHGFLDISEGIDARAPLRAAGLKPGDFQVAENGHVAYIYLRGGEGRRERAAAARAALASHPGIERVLVPADYPAAGLPTPMENVAVGDLLAIARPDRAFADLGGPATGPYKHRSTHGYLPDHPDNRPVFIAAGPGIRRAREPIRVRNVDLAPTVAALLGLSMPAGIEGRARPEILGP